MKINKQNIKLSTLLVVSSLFIGLNANAKGTKKVMAYELDAFVSTCKVGINGVLVSLINNGDDGLYNSLARNQINICRCLGSEMLSYDQSTYNTWTAEERDNIFDPVIKECFKKFGVNTPLSII